MQDTPTTKGKKLVPSIRPSRAALGIVFALAALIVIAAGVMWTRIADRELRAAITTDNQAYVEHGRALFDLLRERSQDSLRAQCRVLVEDPRLKSTLATEGIDTATVTDILNDLARLRHAGMLVVLSPDGHVFAEANAEELKGLDLSASSVVKRAQVSNEAVVGSWVIGGKLIDLSTMAMRFNATVIAYLVVGQAVDQDLVKSAAETAGVELGLVIGKDLALAYPDHEQARSLLTQVAHDPSGGAGRVIEAGNESYLAAVAELEEGVQTHPRLAIARPLAAPFQTFQTLRWLLWAVPALVVIAILVSFLRSARAVARPGDAE